MNKNIRKAALTIISCCAAGSVIAEIKFDATNGSTNTFNTATNGTDLIVGQYNPNNHVYLENQTTSGDSWTIDDSVDVGQSSGATNSLLSVQNGGKLVIGNSDTSNQPSSGILIGDTEGEGSLHINYDSKVITDNLYLGVGSNETGTVTAQNGGLLEVTGTMVVGSTNSENNVVNINSGGELLISEVTSLAVVNKDGATENLNSVNIGDGGSLLVKGDVHLNDVSDQDSITFESGATLGVGGDFSTAKNEIENGRTILLDDGLSTNNTAQWNTSVIRVGRNTSDNFLIIKNGASATSTNDIALGTRESADSNSILVSGSNSTLSATSITVGNDGDDNSVTVKDGGAIHISSDIKIGASANGSGNSITFTGTGTVATVTEDVNVGFAGDDNSLSIEDAATATFDSDLIVGLGGANNRYTNDGGTNTVAGDFIIGANDSSGGDIGSATATSVATSGNLATVEGDGFTDIRQNLTVGQNGSGSILLIREGGIVNVSTNVVIGENAGDNYIYLQSGTNTQLNVAGNLIVGNSSDGDNRFEIYGGTATIDQDLYLGTSTNQHESKNYIHLSGTNSMLDVANSMHIGASNSINTLTLELGASASVSNLFVGAYEGSTNNAVTVTGNDSLLSISNEIVIGSTTGSNNSMRVTSGGTLEIAQEDIIILGTNNTLAVDGGILKTLGWDFDAQTGLATNITFDSGSTLHVVGGSLSGTNSVEGGLDFILDGAGAVWAPTTTNMYVGNESGYNSLTLTNGASALATNIYGGYAEGRNKITVSGSNSTLTALGDMSVGHDSQYNALMVQDGATATATNLYIGYSAGNNTVTVEGTNASLTALEDLFVGYESGYNSLTISNSANVSAANFQIGYLEANNTVTVSGTNSFIDVSEDLFIGSESNDVVYHDIYTDYVMETRDNILNVLEGANLSVSGDAYVLKGATLKIDSKSKATIAGNYTQDEFSALEIGISSNQVTSGDINLVVEGDANFTSSYSESRKLIKIYDEGIGESNVVTIVKAGAIYLDDEEAKTGSMSGHIATNSLLGFKATLYETNGYTVITLDDFIKSTIGESGELEGQLLAVSQEIEALASDPANTNATDMIKIIADLDPEEIEPALDAVYGEKMSSIPAHNVINMGIQSVANQLTMRADSTRSRMGTASADVNFDKPEGAEGPHQAGQELQGWINAYGTWGSQDATDGFSGYDSDVTGFMIGADFSVAENILVGIAGGKGNGSIDKDTGSSTDTDSVHAAIYGSMGTKDWFVDASFIYGITDVDTRMGSTFDTTSDYSAHNVAFYVGGGKEMKTDYFIFTPQLSMLANSYSQDGYTEEASNAVEREVDSFDAFYLQSSLGCSMGMYMGSEDFTFKPEIRAHWLHEWIGDDENINYKLVGGTGSYNLVMQAPEKDILKIGVGAAAKIGEYLELRADLDTRQSGSYSDYTLLGSLRYQF